MCSPVKKSEIVIPEWLNEDFFSEVFTKNPHLIRSSEITPVDCRQQIIKDLSVTSATKIGDNYMSSLYRARILTENDEVFSFVVKSMSGSAVDAVVELFQAFPKEKFVYKNIIPVLEEIWLTVAGERIKFGPKCYFDSTTPTSLLVFEDLCSSGYELSHQDDIGMPEVEVLIAKLAKFHAASLIYHQKNGPFDDVFCEGIAKEAVRPLFEEYYDALFSQFIVTLQEWDFALPYVPKIQNWRHKIFETNHRLTRTNPECFNVLNHGDAWIKNLMFKVDQNGKIDALMVDYQHSVWSSPAVDLLYFIFNSCQDDVIFNQFDTVIKLYHKILVESLERLKWTGRVASYTEIVDQVNQRGFFGAMMCAESIAIMKMDTNVPAADLELIIQTTPEAMAMKREIFGGKKFKTFMERFLPFCDQKGYLDIDKF